jgi:hypothetical protein
MSDLFRSNISVPKAKSFNAKMYAKFGLGDNVIPPKAIEAYPKLACSPDSEDFLQGVIAFQSDHLCEQEVDGLFGRQTWTNLLKKFDPITDDYVVYGGQRLNINSDVLVTPFDDPRGLDLHKYGKFSSRGGREIKNIVIHWGGLDPKHCFNVFTTREASSHFGIGLDENGDAVIYQWLDLEHNAWHGGPINKTSIGIDICQQPTTDWHNHYKKKGYAIKKIPNPTEVGRKEILSLDPKIANATYELVKGLCELFTIPMRFPRGFNGESLEGDIHHGVLDKSFALNEFSGVLGHHHVDFSGKGKWDIACWWEAVFNQAESTTDTYC